MAFIDASLLDRVAYEFSGGPTFATTKVSLISGRVKRNAERSMPLHRYRAPFKNINPEHYALIVGAYNSCLGPVHSFRFKDYMDYVLDDVIIGTAVGGTDEEMQIVKPYVHGTATLNRIITKPVDGTITITEDDVPLASTTDPLTGIVTFTSTAGKVIRASGEFDVPVMFEDDDLDTNYNTWEHLSIDIVLVEDFNA